MVTKTEHYSKDSRVKFFHAGTAHDSVDTRNEKDALDLIAENALRVKRGPYRCGDTRWTFDTWGPAPE